MDFDLKSPQWLLSFYSDSQGLSNIFISPKNKVFYWKYNDSTEVYQYDFSSEKLKNEKLGQGHDFELLLNEN